MIKKRELLREIEKLNSIYKNQSDYINDLREKLSKLEDYLGCEYKFIAGEASGYKYQFKKKPKVKLKKLKDKNPPKYIEKIEMYVTDMDSGGHMVLQDENGNIYTPSHTWNYVRHGTGPALQL